MTVPGPVAIIGAGRMGRGLAAALTEAGIRGPTPGSSSAHHQDDTLQRCARAHRRCPTTPSASAAAELARERGGERAPRRAAPLRTAGSRRPRPLAVTGAALGSFHPLQSIADPASAPAACAGRSPDSRGRPCPRRRRAARHARSACGRSGSRPARKPAYHAGAVFASNYLVVLAAVAEQLARRAGVPARGRGALYLPLMQGAVANLELGPAAALTGPVRRGDAATVRRHLARSRPGNARCIARSASRRCGSRGRRGSAEAAAGGGRAGAD